MAATQRIVRIRREYNQWVANETLEDYSLRFTAKSARRWSSFRVANTALGAISFLALEAIGGAIALNYGFVNSTWAIVVVGAIIFLTGLPISYYAARYGIDMDLLTRGAGFGYIGSTITSLIYASFTFIFFAIEAAIMSLALELAFGIPLWLGYIVCSVVIVPLVTHGITFISQFQMWTQPLWLLLHLVPFAYIAVKNPGAFSDWTTFAGHHGDGGGRFDLMLFGTASAVVFSLIAQIGEQVDFLRFLPAQASTGRARWWAAMLSAGPGWIVLGTLKLLAGSFLAFLALQHELTPGRAAEPTQMYLTGFHYVFSNSGLALAVTALFVILSQLKINVTNAYAGSIAWSNFFARLTHIHPGRVVWLVFNVFIALLLMELGVFRALEQVLGLYSNVAIAWVGALVADLVVNKPLGLSPRYIEFRRAHLYDINPVGVGAMLIASVAAILCFSGVFGEWLQAMSPFVALGVAFATAPAIALATRGRYYVARTPRDYSAAGDTVRCVICENAFEPEDMARCPAYAGAICSLCCSLDARCHDACKPHARLSQQVTRTLEALLAPGLARALDSRLGHYFAVLGMLGGLIAIIFALVDYQVMLNAGPEAALVSASLWKVFLFLMLVAGVAAWLFVLAQESRRVAESESQRQTRLLMREIRAHKRTDAQLQRAKEAAESANLAKSRYVTGISHELRTPLNTILGYAQLMQREPGVGEKLCEALGIIRRSGDHLASLIDGLLDIARIEAGKLHLHRGEIRLNDFLAQLVGMFRVQAANRGLEFRFERASVLPDVVSGDEKRLRQILINLLSNAIKFTESGSVTLRVGYRRQLVEFEVRDTGIGIAPDDQDRVFQPFERGRSGPGNAVPGTGLGLTISKLLTEIMGGSLSLESAPGAGSSFRVKVMLSPVAVPSTAPLPLRLVTGYHGPRRAVLVTDDDATHREFMVQLLEPLGFRVLTAEDATACLAKAATETVHLFLLDISMPGIDGWTLARRLRDGTHEATPIVMVSANAFESRKDPADGSVHDGFLVKPVDFSRLFEKLQSALHIEWRHDNEPAAAAADAVPASPAIVVPRAVVDSLRALGEIGYVRGIQRKLDELESGDDQARAVATRLRPLVRDFQLKQFLRAVEALGDHAV
ncbi:MAG: response regulator [Betaproteobacteria bacterium]|nr:response regulator [Betaproteobacteria bacterium]